MKPPVWLVHRAQVLAHRILMKTYRPSPGVPGPGSLAWECAVQGMAAGMVEQAMRMLAAGEKPPTHPPTLEFGPNALDAATQTLVRAQQIALDGVVNDAERAANG